MGGLFSLEQRRAETSAGISESAVPDACIDALNKVIPKRFAAAVGEAMAASGCIEELRFRVNRPVQLITRRGEIMLRNGAFTAGEAKQLLEAVCSHSVYAKEAELVRGFVSLPGGVRVGIAGEPLAENGKITRLTTVSCFNIRIPRELIGCAEPLIPLLTEETGEGRMPVTSIIAAPPGAGKTTFLRDCARCFSSGIGAARPLKVAVADERNELAGSVGGVPTLNIGERTDVMAGAPKTVIMPMLLRSMSPEVIVTDEIGGEEDMRAVSEAATYGAAVFASIHAGSSAELRNKKWLIEPIENGLKVRVLLLRRIGGKFALREAEMLGRKGKTERAE